MSRKISALKRPPRVARLAFGVPIALLMAAPAAMAAKPVPPDCQITQAVPTPDLSGDPACDAQVCTAVGGSVLFEGAITGSGTPPFSVLWEFPGGNPFETSNNPETTVYNAAGSYTATFNVTDARGKNCSSGSDVTRSVRVIGGAPPGGGDVSINSTSANDLLQITQVPEQPFDSTPGFTVIGINDLGIHCADIDNRVMAILPPFNVLHAMVIKKGTGETPETLPQILTPSDVEVVYSAASNPLDPVLDPGNPPELSILPGGDVYKTNFWELNPRGTGNILGFDMYDPFYPDGVLDAYNSVNSVDAGLPVPDLAVLYPPGSTSPSGALVADQAHMPGAAGPYVANDPKHFDRFDTRLPFFVGFPFGYELTDVNWFAADGVPASYADDEGRENAYPLVRVQARAVAGNSLGVAADTTLASVDTVVPISIEADCKNCHVPASAGILGNRAVDGLIAACTALDANCNITGGTEEGSPRSGTAYAVATPDDDPSANTTQLMSEEWAADTNIVRLHDAKHGTSLEANIPIACQSCHYTPALDLAHFGPSDDNGKGQTTNKSFSNVMHANHGQYADLFPTMEAPVLDGNGAVTNQAARVDALDKTCYGCHPGKRTQCLRGAMFQGEMLCQDCHGNMADVGADFTRNVSPDTPGAFEVAGDFYTDPTQPRVPWANEPMCQSCHTGDAVDNLAGNPDTVAAHDDIRLLRAYSVDTNGDPSELNARPLVASNRRFAENQISDAGGDKQILYRLSKGHGGVFCEACHGATHSIWPVTPRSGPFVANDNATATQLQGHDGKLQECDVCHERDAFDALTMPLGLNGPHGMHAVNDERWNLDHRSFTGSQLSNCKTCHGTDLTGTALSTTSAARVLICKNDKGSFADCAAGNPTANVTAGTPIGCGNCHRQK